MNHLAPLIIDLAIILGLGSVVMLCCRQLKQPLVLGYLIAGMIIGPYTPPHILITDIPSINVAAEIGVIFLMFSIGLDFSFHRLKRIGKPALTTGFFEVIAMLLIGYGLGRLIGWNATESLFLGAALSISSTTIIVKALNELQLRQSSFAELIIGVLVVEDLLAILLLVSLPLLALSSGTAFDGRILYELIKLVLVVSAWFIMGYFIVPTVFRKWIKEAPDEVLIVVSVSLCFGMVCLAAFYDYSVALGAFVMGSILAETQVSHRIEKLVQPLRDVYAAVFFVAIGMLIDPVQIWRHLGLVLLITVVTILSKVSVSFYGAYLGTHRVSTSAQVGLGMAQIGEFSFIITGLGVSLNLLSESFYPIIVAVSVLTTFTTPYLIRLSVPLAGRLKRHDSPAHVVTSSKKMLSENTVTYVINMIVVAIIFSIMRCVLSRPFSQAALSEIVIDNLIFAGFYLLAAPFIAMLFIAAKRAKSILLKIVGSLVALLELLVLNLNYFGHFVNLLVWLVLMLALSLGFQGMWSRVYDWLAAYLRSNLKQEK